MSKQSFLQGTLILILAGMITRFLGFINRMVLARFLGEEGVGLYMMALPTLFLVMTLTQLGLPVAISKRVAEADARNDTIKIKKILVTSLILTAISSITFTIAMIAFAPFIAQLTDKRTLLPLIAISPILPITAISAVIKGYFQGKQNMKPQSYTLVIEQIIRISSVFLFVTLLRPYGIEYATAGAMFSVILGEFVSLTVMIYIFKRKKTLKIHYHFFQYLKKSKTTLKELLSIAIPNTGSRLIASISNFLEPILVAQSLALTGISSQMATKQYGELTGFALPLLFLPTFITNSLSIALVPTLSEADANQDETLIHYRLHQSIRISFASGAFATIVLTLFAVPILTYMYGTGNASRFLVMMAPFYLLLYIQAPLQSALQALDQARPAMWNSLIGAIGKFSVLILLASSPIFGIMGVAIAMATSVVLITMLHLISLQKIIQYHIPFKDTIKMLLLLGCTWGVGSLLKQSYHLMQANLIVFILILIVFGVFYTIMLFTFHFITKDELKQIPFLQKWIH